MSSPRLRTDFWVAALRRRAEAAGAYVSIARRGADEAGAIFVVVDRRDGRFDLYGPAPQSVFDEDQPMDRLFALVAQFGTDGGAARSAWSARSGSIPTCGVIDIEDRDGRGISSTS